jgi:hypothetical protein
MKVRPARQVAQHAIGACVLLVDPRPGIGIFPVLEAAEGIGYLDTM